MLVAKRAIKDHWADWDTTYVSKPNFDVRGYQEKLDNICGKSRGESIMKLFWGGDETIQKFVKWGPDGQPSEVETVPRFAIPRTSFLGTRMYIPVRRWIICERMEPEQLQVESDADNTFEDERGVKCYAGDKKDKKHLYVPYIYVGDHSKCPSTCCDDRICLGDYKEPDNAELHYLAECTYNLSKDFKGDPYSVLSKEEIAQFTKDYEYETEKASERNESEFEAESKALYNTHFSGKEIFIPKGAK